VVVKALPVDEKSRAMKHISRFLRPHRPMRNGTLPALSLFSGAGISDFGFEIAGFSYVVQSEIDHSRAELCKLNFPHSCVVVGDLLKTQQQVINSYQESGRGTPALLSITPPCQGMSSSNPGRGKKIHIDKRDTRNRLLLDAVPVITALQPRIVVVENVVEILSEIVEIEGEHKKIIDVFTSHLEANYEVFVCSVQVADYGIPQTRKRAIVIAIRREEAGLKTLLARNLLPIPRTRYSENWVTVREWFEYMHYPALDAKSRKTAHSKRDPIHFVPSYEKEPHRYTWIEDIPAHSGQNAYQNSNCRNCNFNDVPENDVFCPECGAAMINRPHVKTADGTIRRIKGFDSSYRRMFADRPAPTVMTNSSHMGSDYKIHPWENRVLSIRECTDLQTVPRFYDWSWALKTRHTYTIREVVGEALPTYFTYLLGQILERILSNRIDARLFQRNV